MTAIELDRELNVEFALIVRLGKEELEFVPVALRYTANRSFSCYTRSFTPDGPVNWSTQLPLR